MEEQNKIEESKDVEQHPNGEDPILKAEVGENEGSKALEEKDVKIASIQIQTKTKDKKLMDNALVNIHVKHPDKEELIKLTAIKWQQGNDLIVTALFVTTDDDGKFMKDSGIATLLAFNKIKTLKELEGLDHATVKQDDKSKYLALKCY